MRIEVLFWLLALEHYRGKIRGAVIITSSGCWEWTRATDGRYGKITILGRAFKAHVAAAILWKGIVLRTRVLRHQCDNTKCCNPECLLPGTQKQNRQEASERGRVKHGLTKAKVARVRRLLSAKTERSYTEIARIVGCHRTTVMRIEKGVFR